MLSYFYKMLMTVKFLSVVIKPSFIKLQAILFLIRLNDHVHEYYLLFVLLNF